MSDKYFREEYNYLVEQGREFAKQHPQRAAMLRMTDNRSRDPNVEHLLQGFAFLTSRIRKKIDDDFPEIADGMLSMVWPDYMKPIPSFCLLEFRPRPWDLQEVVTVPAGAEIDSQPLDDEVRCRFRTCFPTPVLPIRLSAVQVEPMGSVSRLRFSFELFESAGLSGFAGHQLRIQLFGEMSTNWELYGLLLGMNGSKPNIEAVELNVQGGGGEVGHFNLDHQCVTPAGLTRDEALLPAKDTALWRFGRMREYFSFPEKFHAFSLDVLDQLSKCDNATGFEIVLNLNQPWPAGLRVEESFFRTNCVPVANLFRRDSEPIKLDRLHQQYKVLGDLSKQDIYQIYSVEDVEGVEMSTGKRRKYQPLYTVRHQVSGETDSAQGPFYSITRSEASWGGWDVYLSPVDQSGRNQLPEEEVLSISLICSNGVKATRVEPGKITDPVSSIGDDLQPSNLTHPTPPAWPALDSGGMWRWLAHVSANYLSLSSADQLRTMVGLYDLSNDESNKQRVKSITDVSIQMTRKLIKGSMVAGNKVEITLNEEGFGDRGDVLVFAYVLSSFMASYASINSFVQLTVNLEPSSVSWVMPINYGQRQLL